MWSSHIRCFAYICRCRLAASRYVVNALTGGRTYRRDSQQSLHFGLLSSIHQQAALSLNLLTVCASLCVEMALRGVRQLQQMMNTLTKGNTFDSIFKNIVVLEGGDGKCLLELPVEESHLNRGATLHGGVMATLVDTVTTVALMTTREGLPGVSVDLNVSYMRPAVLGDVLLMEAKALNVGKSLAFLTVEIYNKETGKILAHGKHTKFVATKLKTM